MRRRWTPYRQRLASIAATVLPGRRSSCSARWHGQSLDNQLSLFQCIQTGVVPEDVWRAAPQPFLPTQFLNDFIYPGFVSSRTDGTSPSVTCDSDMASPLD